MNSSQVISNGLEKQDTVKADKMKYIYIYIYIDVNFLYHCVTLSLIVDQPLDFTFASDTMCINVPTAL